MQAGVDPEARRQHGDRGGRSPASRANPSRPRLGQKAQQILPQLGGGLIAPGAVLLQRSGKHPVQALRNRRVVRSRRLGGQHENRLVDRCLGVALEGAPPGGHLVQHQPQGKEIGPRVQPLFADLLG